MHISEGVLSGPVLLAGGVLATAGTAVGLKNLDYDRIAHVGILSSAFFIASLIHVNVGPASVHLILNGIVGLLLGWAAIPAILVALVLQCLFFQYGGLTTLGVNTIVMALPAVLCYHFLGPLVRREGSVATTAAFATGSGSVLLSSLLLGISLLFTEESFLEVVGLILAANLPVMVIEGIVTVFCVAFLKKVHPVMLPGYRE